jgi:guanine deaminase
LNQAYKTAQVLGNSLSAPLAFYLATRGGARALHLEDQVGSLAPGMEADVLVMDLKSTPAIEFRLRNCNSFEEMLFVQMTLGDDRAIRETWIAGELAHTRA